MAAILEWLKNVYYDQNESIDILGRRIWTRESQFYNRYSRFYHREDGPAIEDLSNGDRYWYLYGKLHRTDGPAIEQENCKSWYLHGKKWPEGEHRYLAKLVTNIALAMAPLKLPAYVLLWILEYVEPNIKKLNQLRLIEMLQNLKRKPRDTVL